VSLQSLSLAAADVPQKTLCRNVLHFPSSNVWVIQTELYNEEKRAVDDYHICTTLLSDIMLHVLVFIETLQRAF
jgi:hypothetical protein